MYFAPGTSGSITASLLTVLQEMTASSKANHAGRQRQALTAPAARQQKFDERQFGHAEDWWLQFMACKFGKRGVVVARRSWV